MSIKLKKKQCDGPCGQIQFIFKNKDGKRYCRSCSVTIAGVAKKSGKSKPTVRQYPISKRSNKKAAEAQQLADKETAKAALLDRLGITAEEAKLLLS